MTDELLKYAESLVAPIKVCVIDKEEEVCFQIEDALSVYNCNVRLRFDPTCGCACLQSGEKCLADLVFIADNVPHCMDTIQHIEREQPDASIVVLTRTPGSPAIAEIMRRGVYTFLTKNGSFTPANVRRIFAQLNLRLHASGLAEVEAVQSEPQPS